MSDRPPTILEIQRARANEAQRLMEVYDREVYFPALRALRVCGARRMAATNAGSTTTTDSVGRGSTARDAAVGRTSPDLTARSTATTQH